MSKNIKTQEAKLDLITKFLDYANIADASYAMLDLIDENDEKGFFDSAFTPPLWLYADGVTNLKNHSKRQ
ncbi:hypothetical protein [Campylobacter coli]|uniref:hypothetical protein n=1 Tax=Campylobacter coli TaxID=195 RepID=UPI0011A754F4|nr:hypothetical protein [Campylobacter coli]HED6588339.1 hypothetical protein [Campylobacter coli]